MSSLGIEALLKILELEQAKGYRNTAVIGGLDSYLHSHLNKIKDNSQSLFISQICPPGFSYAALTQDKRKEWAERAHRHLSRVTAVDGEPANKVSPSRRQITTSDSSLDSSITVLNGVGPTIAHKFARLGVKTVRDALYFFPRRHLDYGNRRLVSDLEVGTEQTLIATVWEARQVTLGNRRGTEAIVGDETGNARVVWFNQPYLAKSLRTNAQIVLSGKVELFKGKKVFESPEWEILGAEDLTHTGRLVPIYPSTEGLPPRTVRRLMKETLSQWRPKLNDFLPPEVRDRCSLMELSQAVQQAHYPDSEQSKDEARRRLAFDELFVIQLGVFARKQEWQGSQATACLMVDRDSLERFVCSLPFTFTSAQQRVLEEILSDLEKSKPMCRLLQGDVGSGKTVIATIALLMTAANGYQGALMAPTEILAEQHFNTISNLISRLGEPEGEKGLLLSYPSLPPYPFTMALLIGSLGQGEKRKIQELIRQGNIQLVIGTHALIQKGVEFKKLALAVVDEQHRFGVLQRSALRQKGTNPHILVMTATPIPRTLALTFYGDLDLSVIDELPPGRVDIETRWISPKQREAAYTFVRRKVSEGRQAFVICPLIEESESIETKAAVAEYQRLSEEIFPDFRLGLLHGRMSASEKEEVMRSFRDGKLDILVSTPVVEVGIDVPNAAVMVIEGADRFGLSQLHQFRGRVGRGEYKSYCILLSETTSLEGKERLKIIEQTRDGFLLAEEDLRLRGPGEFFGTRQSGIPDLRMAKLSDITLLELAREEALCLLQHDRGLKKPEHCLLANETARLWQRGKESD